MKGSADGKVLNVKVLNVKVMNVKVLTMYKIEQYLSTKKHGKHISKILVMIFKTAEIHCEFRTFSKNVSVVTVRFLLFGVGFLLKV